MRASAYRNFFLSYPDSGLTRVHGCIIAFSNRIQSRKVKWLKKAISTMQKHMRHKFAGLAALFIERFNNPARPDRVHTAREANKKSLLEKFRVANVINTNCL